MILKLDYGPGRIPKYKLDEENENLMQIPDEIRKCVVFVCYNTANGTILAGTAFFIGVQLGESNLGSTYSGRHETLTHYICISYKSTISCFPNSL